MWSGNFGMGGMWIIAPIMVVVVLFVVFVTYDNRKINFSWRGKQQDCYRGERQESVLDILKRRYANGEISRDEYETLKNDLL